MDISVSEAPVGRLLDGRYRVEALLARGGMATVYKATDTRLGRRVALKVMHAELAADDDFVARFIGEARSVAQLSDPNVVNVFDQGEDDGAVFLAMEYIEGRTLRDVLHERGRLGAALALEVAESVLSALAAAHRAGIVHRDVKPENVLVGNDGRVKVADFGLARAVSSSSKTTRGLLGTVNYISPEQALGDKATPRSDVYAAGIMLYELLVGRPPHDGPTDFVVVRCHIDEDVPPPSASVPLPPVVDELTLTAAARHPEARYADAGEFLAAVRSARSSLAGFASVEPDSDEAAALSQAHAESRDSAGVALNEALGETVLAGQVVDTDDDAGYSPDAPGADLHAGHVRDDATSTADDVSMVSAATPPPPPPTSARTRVIATPDAAESLGSQRDDAAPARSQPGATTDSGRLRSRRGLIMFLVVLLLAVGVAGTAWWYGSGRWATTPSLLNLSAEQAEAAAADEGFTAERGGEEFSETVEAGLVVATDPAPGEQILDGGEITYVVSKGPERYEVPDLTDMTIDAANEALDGMPLTLVVADEAHHDDIAEGHIVKQDVEPGGQARADTEIGVVVSAGPKPIEIKDFTGQPAEEAQQALSDAGFKVSTSEDFSDSVEAGRVISQSPAEGTGTRGDVIELVVSSGPQMVEVPAVVGQPVDQAERTLRELGFHVEVVDLLDAPGHGREARVVRLDPPGGSQPHGTTLTLYHF